MDPRTSLPGNSELSRLAERVAALERARYRDYRERGVVLYGEQAAEAVTSPSGDTGPTLVLPRPIGGGDFFMYVHIVAELKTSNAANAAILYANSDGAYTVDAQITTTATAYGVSTIEGGAVIRINGDAGSPPVDDEERDDLTLFLSQTAASGSPTISSRNRQLWAFLL
jgi:hypothetical protein